MARVFLTRAYEAPTRDRKLKNLRLAVINSVRAQTLEATPGAGTKKREASVATARPH
jgi:hypothetical protein